MATTDERDKAARGAEHAPNAPSEQAPRPRRRKRKIALGVVCAVIALAIVGVGIAVFVGRSFTAQETAVRSDWDISATGELIGHDDEFGVSLYTADLASNLIVGQLVPDGTDEEGFTYYDTAVQDRIAGTLDKVKERVAWTASNPLAVLNPYGTGSNGLYLYFETDLDTRIDYTVHVDDPAIPDFSATAQNCAEGCEDEKFSTVHEFQLIGLVPGKTNEVTLTVTGSFGIERQVVTFSVTMPETKSGYATQLEGTEGSSTAQLSDGLFAAVRQNGYLGYGFFYDNHGILRYEMVTEGLGLDRILYYGDDIVVCSSAGGIARVDGLGRAVAVYDLGEYVLHHDINYSGESTLVALVEREGAEAVEDVVIELDLETGAITELVDFTELMADYVEAYAHVIGPTDTFFWQAGELDWIHLNTVEYLAEDDSLVVSSRETSTIMKVANVHADPALDYFIGDEEFWEGTPYEGLNLAQVGDFKLQYGQHSVEYDGEGPTEGSYYLLMYDNNYWALSTRSGYSPDLSGTDASTDLYNGTASYVYRYLVDEKAGTFELVMSFPVPYSSIVSNVAHTPESTNYVVNSGISHVFGEYDESGALIREFSYDCQLQGYRVFKESFKGLWFADDGKEDAAS